MKKTGLVTLLVCLELFLFTSAAFGASLFGPKQYVRTKGEPNSFTDAFSSTPSDGALVVRNGKGDGSRRITDAISSASVVLNGEEIFGPKDFNKNVHFLESPVNVAEENLLEVELSSSPGSYITIEVTGEGQQPTITLSSDREFIILGEAAVLTWTSTNGEAASMDQGIGDVPVNGSMTVSPVETTTYTVSVTGTGGTATNSLTLTVIHPPTVSIRADPESIQEGESSTLTWNATNADSCFMEPGIGPVDVNGWITVSPTTTTTYSITATGLGGSATLQASVIVTGELGRQPEGSFGEQYEDLVPPDATAESYDPKRFSVITGLVHSIEGVPISAVMISILGHPGYGTVLTDASGRFSIPVEGGGGMTVVYQKEGLLTAHRQVFVPWNDIAITESIQMTGEDSASTTVTFDGNPETVFTHESTRMADEFGSRSCSMVFTGDNQAYEVDARGNVLQELTMITTRATEYATPESMPAKLPPNSAYTYCVELSVDGVNRVQFGKPIITWVDNFLGFDVGEPVPVGYYDRSRVMSDCLDDTTGVWVPSDNGVVVKLLDRDADGIVDAMDADGDGQPDDLNQDGAFSDEVTGLEDAAKYAPGTTFWRFAVNHFTPVDLNWPWDWPEDSTGPDARGRPSADGQKSKPDPCRANTGSFVEQRSRIFHEDIPIPGTDMTLHYASNRVEGYRTVITVPASGDTVPASLKRIIVKVDIAGRTLEQVLSPLPNQIADFQWNGLDYLGRPVRGPTNAHISVGFVYDAVYTSAGDFERAFGQPGDDETGVPARQELTRWERSDLVISGKSSLIAEGWTLSTHHNLSPMDPSRLYKGDGTLSMNDAGIITPAAGIGTYGYSGDGGAATQAQLATPSGVALDTSGNLFIADEDNLRIRKVDDGGIITTVAGNGNYGYSGDGGPATQAEFAYPGDVALDAMGNLFIADQYNYCVRKVDTCGIITTVAGIGTQGYSGDGGPASQAQLGIIYDIALDGMGNLYMADSTNKRLRKVDTNGIITTVAGNGVLGYSGDGGPAIQAELYPSGVTVDGAGSLYIADYWNKCIRQVDTSGIITTVAGNGTRGYSGDGGPATLAQLAGPHGGAVDAAGNYYFADYGNYCVRQVDTSGIITTVAGNGNNCWGYCGDGGPPVQAQLGFHEDVALDAAGNLYIADYGNERIRKVASPAVFLSGISEGDLSFADEGGLGHIFSSTGRHKKTIGLDTGAVLREFGYNEEGLLVSVTDRFGNQVTIERDGDGVPTSITSPQGLTTALTIDANNRLTAITYPDDGSYTFEYTSEGLLTAKDEPEGNRFEHVFDATGRLTHTTDDEGGHWQFSRVMNEDAEILTEVITGEGNLTSYLDFTDSTGVYTATITDPTGAQTLFLRSADGLSVNKSLPCGMELDLQYDLDPMYKFKYEKHLSESTPSGLKRTTDRERTYQDMNGDSVPDLIAETVTVNGKSTVMEDDLLYAQKTETSPEGRAVTTRYDPATLLASNLIVPGLYETIYGYDSRGRLTSINTNTRQTIFSYNAHSFLESSTDPEGHNTTYEYDRVGRLTAIHRPDLSSVGFDYDLNGNMTLLTTPSNVPHGFGHSGVNLNTSYQPPLSGSYSYFYDKDRKLIQTNFPSGKAVNNIYDETRLMQIQTPDGNIDYTYLCSTKVGSITNGTNTITYGYDGKLLTSETLSGTLNQPLSYAYNNRFEVTGFTYAGDTQVFTYDRDGLLTTAGAFAISRNAGNGLSLGLTGGSLKLTRTFNGYGEVAGQDLAVGGLILTAWNLTRDDNGRITSKTGAVEGVASHLVYTYDAMGRLLTVTKDQVLTEEYQYGPNGTRTYEMNLLKGISGRTFDYSDEDHLLTAGTTTYEYDLDGFLTTKTDDSGMTQYTYSSRGELLMVTVPDGTLIEYIHDPSGRRIGKRVDGNIVEKYLWQGQTRLLAVFDTNDNLLMRFEYADDRMPVTMTRDGATHYLAYDQVGSLRVIADASGNVIKRVDYDSFGSIINDDNPLFKVPFGFAGGFQDPETGLLRFGHRDYDPDVGRWTAKDPILFCGGDTDLYGYCLNDPVNLVDPTGLVCGPGFLGDLVVPDSPGGFDFAQCCAGHDRCYAGEGDACNKSKEECDDQFYDCMLAVCRDRYLSNRKCQRRARQYHWAVDKLGGLSFQGGRR